MKGPVLGATIGAQSSPFFAFTKNQVKKFLFVKKAGSRHLLKKSADAAVHENKAGLEKAR